uniref:Uncharacterized protein n=1 Tax=Globisporangium ultimum (strain ATCC 200006 / CBS 805.95 / DAOM BR144) TaxID=431595 RepID=K3WWG5_GLOUD
MHAGRAVVGLLTDGPEFAVMPPHFVARDELIDEAIGVFFLSAPASIKYVAEFALASMVHHAAYLKSTLPSNHAVLNTALFQDEHMWIEYLL